MGASTAISWTDASWNPLRGCSRVSEGCTNCYAESLAARFSGPGQPYEGLAATVNGHPRWTNTVRLVPEHLEDPLRWKRPRRVFVNSMSDLFHEQVSDSDLRDIFSVMQRAHRHTFQALTKRPERMARFVPTLLHEGWQLPSHIWLGASVEHQAAADTRIVHVLNTPVPIRFLSCEPLLSPLQILQWLTLGISWVIIGGESGTNHRPMDLHWLEALVQQCRDAEVAIWVKQDSGRLPGKQGRIPNELWIHEFPAAPQ